MSVTPVIEGIIDLISKNMVAKTNAVSNALTGQIQVNVEDAFHFFQGDEVVILDYGYNDPLSPHYQIYEYRVIKEALDSMEEKYKDEILKYQEKIYE